MKNWIKNSKIEKILIIVLLILVVCETIRFVLYLQENLPYTGMVRPSPTSCLFPWDYGKTREDFPIHQEQGFNGWECVLTQSGLTWKRKAKDIDFSDF